MGIEGERLTLYLIGNGFDLHHGVPSAYHDFACFLEHASWPIWRMVDRYFSVDRDFWDCFETRLAEFDADTAMDDASGLLSSYGSDDWRDSANHDYQYELQQIAEGLSSGLRGHFADWVRSLPIPDPKEIGAPLRIDPGALFLNFNYTPTLERLYGVPRDRILYVHGCASDPTEALILGHGWERVPEDRFDREVQDEDSDMRILEGNSILDDYFDATFKPTAKVIEAHTGCFERCSSVGHVKVMGHSLGIADEPYIEEIMDRVDLRTTRWTISYYNDLSERQGRFGAYAIDPALVDYRLLTEF